MREECLKALWKGLPLRGRKLDLCEGRGLDGRINPLQQDSDKLRYALGLEPIVVAEPQAIQVVKRKPTRIVVSKIGTRLHDKFYSKWGAIPCGNCKEAILDLNSLTPDEVQADRDRWVKSIIENSKESNQNYWLSMALTADQFLHLGGTEYLIGKYLDEACKEELNDGQKQ